MCDKVKIDEVEPATQELLNDCFKGIVCARFGDPGYLLNASYTEDADNFRNMPVRPDDVWVTTFPRSGTNICDTDNHTNKCPYHNLNPSTAPSCFVGRVNTDWSRRPLNGADTANEEGSRMLFGCNPVGTTLTQELVWLLMNDLDFTSALKIPLTSRYTYLESKHLIYKNDRNMDLIDSSLRQEISKTRRFYEDIVKSPSPRFFKTHLPFSLLPSTLLDTSKVVFVARDPRDIAVSYYHLMKLMWYYPRDLKSFWNLFINDLVPRAPYLTHLKEAWALRHHPNMLFIFYEDMKKDLPSSIKRISDFFGKKNTDKQIGKLCDHLDIENFRKNKSVNPTWRAKIGNPDAEGFVRVGKSGGWREHFDEEMAAQAQRWLREGLAGSRLRFPHDSSLVFD